MNAHSKLRESLTQAVMLFTEEERGEWLDVFARMIGELGLDTATEEFISFLTDEAVRDVGRWSGGAASITNFAELARHNVAVELLKEMRNYRRDSVVRAAQFRLSQMTKVEGEA